MFKLKIVTPQKVYINEEIEQLNIKAFAGDMGILSNHSPLIAMTQICHMVIIMHDHSRISYAINSGVLSFKNNTCLLLTDSIELPDEIDVNRALAAQIRAKEQMADIDSDHKRAMLALARANNRLKVAKYE